MLHSMTYVTELYEVTKSYARRSKDKLFMTFEKSPKSEGVDAVGIGTLP
jgi:hypothetical protein